MSTIKAPILILAALGLAGCASQVSEVSAPAAPQARIMLEPSDAAYSGAMGSLSAAEQKTLKNGLGFRVDTLLVAPTPVEGMAWSRKRPDTPSVVNFADFVRYLDRQPALGGAARVNLAKARVFAGVNTGESTVWPVFRIQVEVEPSNSAVVTVTGFGAGPACSMSDTDPRPASPQLTSSEDIAFMKAFLKTLLRINDQLQQG